ncbi:MAG TPA: hypothetical protein VE641_08895 [Chthoniobacterales bacterium]|nr:hypothetical protein [Chthoniobacterales bacterium]
MGLQKREDLRHTLSAYIAISILNVELAASIEFFICEWRQGGKDEEEKAASFPETPNRSSFLVVSCPTNTKAFATARRIAMKMGRRPHLLVGYVSILDMRPPRALSATILIAAKAMLFLQPATRRCFDKPTHRLKASG